jgi:exonuclease SbcD
MSKVLIIGDPHIGKGVTIGKTGIGIGLNSRVVDQHKILNWLLDIAIQNHVERIIITGDVFEDVKPDYVLVVLFMDWLRACEINNIAVDIIMGNHDIRRSGNNYSSSLDVISKADIEGVTVYKQVHTIHADGVSFTLLPYRDRRALNCKTTGEAIEMISSRLPYELADIPPGHDRVLIGHLALKGSLPIGDEFDDVVNELLCPLNMFNGYDYVWMGHIHRPQVCSRKPHIAHIGSMDLSDFGETDHHKIAILFDSSREERFIELPIPSRPLRRIKMTVPVGKDPTEYVADTVRHLEKTTSFKNSIVKIELKLDDPEASEIKREILNDLIRTELGAQNISSFSESRNVTVVTSDKKDLIDSTVDSKAATKLYAGLLELTEEDNSCFMRFANEVIDEVDETSKG